jgi:hypothetical protein
MYRDIIGIYYNNNKKNIKAFCEENGELLNIIPGGIKSSHSNF